MPNKYDDEFKARAVRLVADHAEEYDTRTACITAVAKRLGVCPTNLCAGGSTKVEVDTGQRDGVPTDIARENKELKRKNRELEETIEILTRRQQVSSRGRATRDTVDLCQQPGVARVCCTIR